MLATNKADFIISIISTLEVIMICHHSKILIVGAGIAGLASYLALKHRGLNADIIENHHQLKTGTGGLLLTSNAVDATKQLGIYPQLKENAFTVSNINYRNEKNQSLMTFAKDKHFPDSAEFFSLHRNLLLKSLEQWVPSDTIQFNRSISALTSHGQQSKVTFNDGTSGTYDLIIGADGIHSQIRSELFQQSRLSHTVLSCIRLVMSKPSNLTEATYYIGQGRSASLLPIDKDLAYCPFVFSNSLLKNDVNQEPVELLKRLFGHFEGLLPNILANIDENTEVSPITPFNSLKMDSWITNNAVLIGDAAHALIPTQPQGAALALEDAIILADSIYNEDSIAQALHKYQLRRFKRVKAVQTTGEKRVKAIRLSQSSIGKAVVQNLIKVNGEKRFKKDWAKLILTPL